MSEIRRDALVSVEWLAAHLHDTDLRVLDATYKMPGAVPDAATSYAEGHIPGSGFFDIDTIADKSSTLPHMLPPPAQFAAQLGALGIGDRHRVIVYDGSGVIGAARAWWMLRAFGHEAVAVLDGGLPAWMAAGRPLTTVLPGHPPEHFTARPRPELVRDRAAILANLGHQSAQVLDARSAARFRGEAAEPWPGRRSGRIPGSFNLDHTMLVDPATRLWRSDDEIAALVADAGIDANRPVITSCGSGITACAVALGLHLIGARDVAVYDGSWAEWGLPGALPVATGQRGTAAL